MRNIALAVCFFIVSGQAFAEDGGNTKQWTFAEAVQEVLARGREKSVVSETMEALGLSGEPTSKALRLRQSESPDQQEHFFKVLFRTEDGKDEASYIIWEVSKTNKVGADKFFDSMAFLIDPAGNLKAAANWKGQTHKTVAKKLSVGSARVKKAFASEKKFCLTDGIFSKYDSR